MRVSSNAENDVFSVQLPRDTIVNTAAQVFLGIYYSLYTRHNFFSFECLCSVSSHVRFTDSYLHKSMRYIRCRNTCMEFQSSEYYFLHINLGVTCLQPSICKANGKGSCSGQRKSTCWGCFISEQTFILKTQKVVRHLSLFKYSL